MPKKRATGRAAKAREAALSKEHDDFGHLLGSGRRTEHKIGSEWTVQSVPASRALKLYVCPDCVHPITPGTAHLVVWRNDHLFGDEAAVNDRRHWHEHCWRLAR